MSSTGAAIAGGLAVVLALAAMGVRLAHAGSIDASLTKGWVFVEALAATVYGIVGALIVRRGGRRLIGGLFLVVALCYGLSAAATEYGTLGLYYAPGSVPEPGAVSSLQSWIWSPANILIATVIPALLPDGRFRSRRWRGIAWATALVMLLALPNGVTNPWPWPMGPPASPWAVTNPTWIRVTDVANVLGQILLPLVGLAAVASVALHRRDAAPERRPALTWLLAGTVAVVLPTVTALGGIGADVEPAEWFAQSLQLVALPLLPVATLVAVLRHRLWGIEVIVRRALVGSLLAAAVLASYAAAVWIAAAIVGGGLLSSAAAAGAVAIVFQPARLRIERAVDELLYGARHDPWAVVRRLGRLVETPAPAGEVPQRIVETLGTELRLGGVELRRPSASASVRWGVTGTSEDVVVPLISQGEQAGSLVVAPVPGDRIDERLSTALAALAPQLTAVVQSALLLDDLRRSREALVLAREEERRRLHRDLHDGLGPALAGAGLAVQAAGNRIGSGRDDEARALLARVADELDQCVRDVRGMVEALRPPLLDELGLLGAVHHHADRWRQSGLDVTVEAAAQLAEVPAAVELAAYHVVRESLTNVARHAGARTCRVVVDQGGRFQLRVLVADDGRGIGQGTPRGVGLRSMADRVADSGGRLDIAAGDGGGTVVDASWAAART